MKGTRRHIFGLLVFAGGVVMFATGCSGPADSAECCREVRQCETNCNAWGCFDDCTTETICPDACDLSCHGDFDCPEGRVCVQEQCVKRNYDRTGTGGLCQSCDTAYDCAEPDARCIRLYFERTPDGGPKVCATDCEYGGDCPLGFECVDEPNTPKVCVPDEKLGSTDRVCEIDDWNDEIACFSADDCPAGQSCIDNTCTPPRGDCTRDAQCPGDQTCRNFECKPASEPECVSRSDCQSAEECVDGTCTPRHQGECVRNEDCGDGGVCVNGSCRSRCSDRSDCNAATEICRQGLCQPIECRYNTDCSSAQVCVNARCRPRCQRDGDCASGYVCDAAGDFCKRDSSVECRSDAECVQGESCEDGTCRSLCGCNQECPTGQICGQTESTDQSAGICQPADQQSSNRECTTACDCPSGKICSDGQCKEG